MKPLAVIPTYVSVPGDLEVFNDCVQSLKKTADADILVVDDGSPTIGLVDEIEALSSRLEFELVRREANEGFARTVNVGLRRALEEGRDAVLVNADVEFMDPNWLEVMRRQPNISGGGLASVVGGLLLYPTGLIQHGGVFFSFLHRCFDHRFKYAPGDLPEALKPARCPVTAALMFIRHDCLADVGLYDENFRLGWEDVDYCIRVFEAGRDCVYQPKVRAFHFESLFRSRPSPKVQDWEARSWLYLTSKYRHKSFAEFVPTLAT